MRMEMRHRTTLAKKSVGELSARPTLGNIAGLFNTHKHTLPPGMLVDASMLTVLD